jgi:hypothetical protein
VKDKLFGFPLGKLQEEGSKTPQTVKVDVQVSNPSEGVVKHQGFDLSVEGETRVPHSSPLSFVKNQ